MKIKQMETYSIFLEAPLPILTPEESRDRVLGKACERQVMSQ